MNFADYIKEYVPKINNTIKMIYDRKINQVEKLNPFLKKRCPLFHEGHH